VFKANSAILNALLTLINERKYHNNGTPMQVPLQSLFGASNELPEGEELGALYDRFMLRYVVNYIAEDSDMKKMLRGVTSNGNTKISIDELKQAQTESGSVAVSDEVLDILIKIRNELKKEGVIASDRRYRLAIEILKASAWLNGKKAVGDEDVVILQHVLWSQPAELKTVQRVVLGTANPMLNRITELFD
jgi:MoxR-like ATPase